MEQRIKQDATNRAELDYARRRAIESVLLSHGLMKYGLDMETDFSAQRITRPTEASPRTPGRHPEVLLPGRRLSRVWTFATGS